MNKKKAARKIETPKKSRKEVKAKQGQRSRVDQIAARFDGPITSAEEYTRHVQELKREVKKLTPEELAEWIMERHDAFVSRIDYQFFHDFLNGTQYMERHLILTYMMEVLNLFTFLDIETLPNETIEYLYKKNYAELLAILNVLNYI